MAQTVLISGSEVPTQDLKLYARGDGTYIIRLPATSRYRGILGAILVESPEGLAHVTIEIDKEEFIYLNAQLVRYINQMLDQYFPSKPSPTPRSRGN